MPTARRKPVLSNLDHDVLRKTNSAKSEIFLDPDIFKVAVLDIETTGLKGDFDIVMCAVIKTFAVRDKPKAFWIDLHKPDLLLAEKKMLAELNDALDEYDGLITYYGSRFDVPMLRTRMYFHGLRPLGKIKHLDLYFTARRVVLMRRRLDNINELFRNADPKGSPQKTRVEMVEWMAAMFSRDKKALDYIIDHCIKDVVILENAVHRFADFVPDRILRR